MNHLAARRIQENSNDVEFTAADRKTIYAVLMDRYEHLDAKLRSLPAPTDIQAIAMEKSQVESVIRRMSN